MRAITRRALLTAAFGGATLCSRAAFAAQFANTEPSSFRVACLDWASAEAMLAVGITPIVVGMPTRGDLSDLVGLDSEHSTEELGSLWEPNLELLQTIKPDLILCAEWQERLRPVLARIAQTHVFRVGTPNGRVLENALAALTEAARLVDRERTAAEYVSRFHERLGVLAAQIAPAKPVLLGTLFPDGRHIVIFHKGCIFDDVLTRLGVPNAWKGPTTSPGRIVQGIEVLANYPDVRFLYLDNKPISTAALAALESSTLWTSLAIVRQRQVLPIASEWPFGGVPTALKFAESIAAAKEGGDWHGHG